MKIVNKKFKSSKISFRCDDTPEEIMLAATFYLKTFLYKDNKIKFGIPERVYIQLGEKNFKEIFTDQINEMGESKNNLLEVNVLKIDKTRAKKSLEVFEVLII